MAWVALGTGAVTVVSSGMQAQIAMEQAETSRMIANMNAGFEDLDSFHALQEGQTEEARYKTQVDSTIADQRTAMAGAGVDVNFGTAKEVQAETQITGLLNGLDIQNQARAKAYGLQIQANNTRLGAINAYAGAAANASSQEAQGLISGAGMIAHGFESKFSGTKSTTGYTKV